MNVPRREPLEPESCGDDRVGARLTPPRDAMSPTPQDADPSVDRISDRALWQRCRLVEMPENEALRLLDLAAFAEGILDADEHDRIEALLSTDPEAAADVAAARVPIGVAGENARRLERIVARACALRADEAPRGGVVVRFSRLRRRVALHGVAQWASFAAALAMAAWLGFAMGTDASLALSRPGVSNEDSAAVELFDPATGFLHDIVPGAQT